MEYVTDGAGGLAAWDETDFDHTDPVAAQDIYRVLAASRERCPVLHSSHHGGFWALMRTALVRGPLSLKVTWEV